MRCIVKLQTDWGASMTKDKDRRRPECEESKFWKECQQEAETMKFES